MVTDCLAQINKFIKCWEEDGKASGRYLLDCLSSELNEPTLTEKIAVNRKEKPTPPNTLKEPYKLWPEKLRFQIPSNARFQDVWQQPFGPLKAEDDPRLPPARYTKGDPAALASDLFFSAEDLDWGKSIMQPEPGFYTCGQGMGKTTFIWMGRHQRRYWGGKPSLSTYMLLSGIANKEKLWDELETAVGKSLLANFVEDPYWLLDAPHKTQERVSVFLISWAGTFSILSKTFKEAGIPKEDQTLIADMFYHARSAVPYQSSELPELISNIQNCMSKGAALRLAPGESFELFWWIELKNVSSVQGWLKLMDEEGLAGLGILKIFSDDQADLSAFHGLKNLKQKQIKWSEDNLRELLEKRLDGCQWNTDPRRWERYMVTANGKSVTKEEFVNKAKDSPRLLIDLGNEILFPIGKVLDGKVSQ